MFTKTTEYALRAAVFLCDIHQQRRNATAHEIAEATKVPVRYMSKVLQTLAESEVVESQRGPTGGFSLARPPADISLLDIVSAVEPIPRVRSCPLNLPEHEHELCPLHRAMDDLAAIAEERLASTTLLEVMNQPVVPLGISARGAPRG